MTKSVLRPHRRFLREVFKRLMVPAIILAASSLLNGLIAGIQCFGSTAIATDFHINTDALSLLVCCFMVVSAIQLGTRLRDKSTGELYGSIPVSRDSIWTDYVIASLLGSLAIIATWLIGLMFGRAIGVFMPDALIGDYGYCASETALSIVKLLLSGIALFGIVSIMFSITGRSFSAIVSTLIAVAFFPAIYLGLIAYSGLSVSLGNHIFPVGQGLRTAAVWVIYIVVPALLLFFSRRALLKARNETAGFAYRTKTLNIVFGVAFVFELSSLFYFFVTSINGGSGSVLLANAIILLMLLALIAYFAFMWISSRKFKFAAKSLLFAPIAFLLVGAVALTGNGLAQAEYKLDLSVNNIESFSVPSYLIPTGSFDYYYRAEPYSSRDRYGKGTHGEEDIVITDRKAIEAICDTYGNITLGTEMERLFGRDYSASSDHCIYITLKDGRCFKFFIDYTSINAQTLCDILNSDSEYINAASDMEDFKSGHFVMADKRFDKLYDTFMEELSLLTPEERMELMDLSVYLDGWVAEDPDNGSFDFPVAMLFAATRDNSCIRGIKLTTATPKTLKAYIELSRADCERDNKFAEHVPHLDSLIDMSMPDDGFIPYYGFESYQLDFIVLDTVTNTSRAFNIGLQSDEVGIQEYISFEEYLENYYGITEADMDEADEEYLDKLRFEYDEMYNTTSPISKEERKACVDWLKGVFTSGTEAADSRYILFISTVKSDLFVKSEKANYYFDCESPYSCMAFQPFCFALTEAQYNALINGGISSSILSEYYSDFFGVGRHGILRSWSSSVYENYFYYGVDD